MIFWTGNKIGRDVSWCCCDFPVLFDVNTFERKKYRWKNGKEKIEDRKRIVENTGTWKEVLLEILKTTNTTGRAFARLANKQTHWQSFEPGSLLSRNGTTQKMACSRMNNARGHPSLQIKFCKRENYFITIALFRINYRPNFSPTKLIKLNPAN